MKEEKEKRLKERERALDAMYIVVGCLVIIVIGVYAINFGNNNLSKDPSEWGVFGDFFGGVLNPIFAFFSFALLLLNLHLQRQQLDKTEEQLELNREELAETRKALERSAQAQEDSKRIMDEQLKTQALQQFDSLFAHMMDQLNKFYDSIDHHHLKIILNSFTNLTYVKYQFEINQKCLRYESYLFLVLKNIDATNFDQTNKQLYVDLIKATIPSDFLGLINISAVDINNKYSKKNYRNLLSKFNFFENLILIKPNKPIETYSFIYLTNFFEQEAYRNNADSKIIDSSWVYQQIIKSNEYQKFSRWVGGLLMRYKFFHCVGSDFKIFFNTENVALIFFKEQKIGSVIIIDRYLNESYISCSGGDTAIGFKIDLTIQKEHALLSLRYFGVDSRWLSIPGLVDGISLYGVFHD